jgi:hypothetical protein
VTQVLAPTLNADDLAAMPDMIRKTKTNIGVLVPRRNREANSLTMATIGRKKGRAGHAGLRPEGIEHDQAHVRQRSPAAR